MTYLTHPHNLSVLYHEYTCSFLHWIICYWLYTTFCLSIHEIMDTLFKHLTLLNNTVKNMVIQIWNKSSFQVLCPFINCIIISLLICRNSLYSLDMNSYQMCLCFFPFCGLLFLSADCILWQIKVLNYDTVLFTYFFLLPLFLVSLKKEIIA